MRASRNVSIALRSGEVRALAGENGAGKSTIVRMLAGVQRPDEGDVLVDGEPVAFHGPADARDAGRRGDLPGADALPGPLASRRT